MQTDQKASGSPAGEGIRRPPQCPGASLMLTVSESKRQTSASASLDRKRQQVGSPGTQPHLHSLPVSKVRDPGAGGRAPFAQLT